MENKSQFTGDFPSYIGLGILSLVITLFTFGIASPWAICIMNGWKIRNTIVDGKRLTFDGTGLELFYLFIKWIFFIVITLGFYALWVPIEFEKWKTTHTHFAE